jgi:rod shape-determining protein MreC
VHNLVQFFLKYNGFFIFMLLEMIAISMVVNERNNPNHSKAFASSSNRLVGGIYEQYNSVARYWNLANVNDSLLKENARLHAQLRDAYFDHTLKQNWQTDSSFEQQYHYIEARVVDNSVNRLNNFITLNRGRNHGIKPNCGVINGSGQGILGIVRNVTNSYSSVMSVLHTDTRVACKLKKGNFSGHISWDGRSDRHMILDAIPKHANLQKGDTVETSGFSGIFPRGIMVGTVDSFYLKNGSNFYTIAVLLSSDLNSAEYAFVVDNLKKTELDTLNALSEKDK